MCGRRLIDKSFFALPTRHGDSAAKNSNSFARVMRLRITTAPAAFTPWI
jgi:hypothetical protein